MPNLAATETSGAASQRTRTLSFALFFLIIACGIVYIAIHPSADLGPARESSVLPFVLPIALGLGTMVGWKRIVVTVGEKVGKSHLTYGLPVSTTHVLASGVAGTMTASGAGLRPGTMRNLVLARVLTLPASIALSAVLYRALHGLF